MVILLWEILNGHCFSECPDSKYDMLKRQSREWDKETKESVVRVRGTQEGECETHRLAGTVEKHTHIQKGLASRNYHQM